MTDGLHLIAEGGSDVEREQRIVELGHIVEQLPQVELPLLHRFSKGVYARSIFMPAGTVVIGKKHRTRHILIMSQGKCSIETDQGMEHLEGFNILDSSPGIRRALVIYEDTIITTIHVTELTDIDAIERTIIRPLEDDDIIEGTVL